MIERGRGRVLNLGSVGSFAPAPMTAAYGATKAYVLSLSLALAEELQGTGVTVTCLCPGPTATGFQARADMAELGPDPRAEASRAPVEVAEAGYEAMKRGGPTSSPGRRAGCSRSGAGSCRGPRRAGSRAGPAPYRVTTSNARRIESRPVSQLR